MRLTFHPAFDDSAALTDHFYRLHWYLLPFRDRITEIVMPVSAPGLSAGAVPDYLDPELRALVGQLPVRIVQADEQAMTGLLAEADCILAWSVGADGKALPHPAIKKQRVIRIDHGKLQNAGSFYLMFPQPFKELQDAYVATSKELFSKIRQACTAKVCYVFGTGPGLSLAKEHDFSDGVSIACNSMVRNYDLMDRLKPPLIVVADPIFHSGPSSYAAAFREDLIRAMDRFGSYLIVPLRDYHVYQTHMPERLRARIAALPFVTADKPNLDLASAYNVTSTGNILTLFLLPLAATFAGELRIFGCDGRPMSENSYFWSHDKASQFNDKMADIQKAHPGFFAIDFDDYYLTHCRILATWLETAEAAGKVVTNHTPSYIPALAQRSTGPIIAAAKAAEEARAAAEPRHGKSPVALYWPPVETAADLPEIVAALSWYFGDSYDDILIPVDGGAPEEVERSRTAGPHALANLFKLSVLGADDPAVLRALQAGADRLVWREDISPFHVRGAGKALTGSRVVAALEGDQPAFGYYYMGQTADPVGAEACAAFAFCRSGGVPRALIEGSRTRMASVKALAQTRETVNMVGPAASPTGALANVDFSAHLNGVARSMLRNYAWLVRNRPVLAIAADPVADFSHSAASGVATRDLFRALDTLPGLMVLTSATMAALILAKYPDIEDRLIAIPAKGEGGESDLDADWSFAPGDDAVTALMSTAARHFGRHTRMHGFVSSAQPAPGKGMQHAS